MIKKIILITLFLLSVNFVVLANVGEPLSVGIILDKNQFLSQLDEIKDTQINLAKKNITIYVRFINTYSSNEQRNYFYDFIDHNVKIIILAHHDKHQDIQTMIDLAHKHDIKVWSCNGFIDGVGIDFYISYDFAQMERLLIAQVNKYNRKKNILILQHSNYVANGESIFKNVSRLLFSLMLKEDVNILSERIINNNDQAYITNIVKMTRNKGVLLRKPLSLILVLDDSSTNSVVKSLDNLNITDTVSVIAIGDNLESLQNVASGKIHTLIDPAAYNVFPSIGRMLERYQRDGEIKGLSKFTNNGGVNVLTYFIEPRVVNAETLKHYTIIRGGLDFCNKVYSVTSDKKNVCEE